MGRKFGIFCIWLLGVLAVVSAAAVPLRAEAIITFTEVTGDQINWNNNPSGVPETLDLATNNGNFGPVTFHNNTGFRFVDFEFSFNPTPGVTGDGNGFFANPPAATMTTLTFSGGPGIGPGDDFTITATGFASTPSIEATPTIPEPTSLTLLIIGALGLFFNRRQRRRFVVCDREKLEPF